MDGSALSGEDGHEPGWGDVRRAVMMSAEICAAAAASLALRGPHGAHAAMMVRELTGAVRDLGMQLRYAVFDEAVIDAERSRAAEEALRAAGLVPPQGRHLHVVS